MPKRLMHRAPPLVSVMPMDALIAPAGDMGGHFRRQAGDWAYGILIVFTPSGVGVAERSRSKPDLRHLIKWAEYTLATEYCGMRGHLYFSEVAPSLGRRWRRRPRCIESGKRRGVTTA